MSAHGSGPNAAHRLDLEGRFWLPDDRHVGYGHLRFSPNDGASIHLVDTNLRSSRHATERGPGPIPVLYGETLGGQPMTLLDLVPIGFRLESNDGDVVDARVDTLVRGVHVSRLDEISASTVRVELQWLVNWLTGGRGQRSFLRPSLDTPDTEQMIVSMPAGELTLAVSNHGSVSRNETHAGLAASARWRFDPPLAIEAVDDFVATLEDLISFSVRQRSYVNALMVRGSDDEWAPRVQVMRRSAPSAEDREPAYLALNLADQADPAALIQRWFDLRARIGAVWKVFFAALDRPESLLEDRLLGILAFAEGYHRAIHNRNPLTAKQDRDAMRAIKAALPDATVRAVFTDAISYANSQTQRQRMTVLTARAVRVLGDWWEVDTDLFAGRLLHTRNWLVHWGKRGRHVVDDSAGLVELIRGLILVVYINLLLDLGLDDQEAWQVVASGWRVEGPPDPVIDFDSESS